MSAVKSAKSTQLNCFSPPVMLATLTIESMLAGYTLWRYKLTVLTRLVIGMLVGLATFQLAEYFVCTGYGLHAEQWSRLGFVAISTLPPLGLHMLHVLADKPRRRAVITSYVTLGAFVAFFLTYSTAFIGHKCTGNYVIFQMGTRVGGVYGIYYYGWLATGIILGGRWAGQYLKQGKPALNRLRTIQGLIVGYLIFMVPTALANTIKPETRQGIPSIMCGFAVLLALILSFYVMPRAGQPERGRFFKTKNDAGQPLAQT